jgi:hypothetical protein
MKTDSGITLYWTYFLENLIEDIYKEHGPENALSL